MSIRIFFLMFLFNVLLNASCEYNLNINFDFKNKQIDVKTQIYDKTKSIELDTKGFDIKNISALKKSLNNGSNKLYFEYSKQIENLNPEFIYLLQDWYPKVNTKCNYRVNTSLDSSYQSIYEKTNRQINNLSFIASKQFVIQSQKYNDILIQTYFLNKNKKLAQDYLNKSIEYIKLYEKKIGKYPYKEFRIVENIFQTGYSMPTFTLIGSRLLNKPYIINQSLGHEILHQYFGNSVFNDFKKGNWIEGLTTYLADDYYKRVLNKDIEHRKSVLNEYHHFIDRKNEFAISEFQYRFDKSSMLIGYSKLSFVFFMLENKIGSKEFDTIIKKLYQEHQFKEINLKQLLQFFDKNSKADLNTFFKQWIYQKGLIDFEVKNIKSYYDRNGFWLEFNITQDRNNFFTFDLPIHIKTYDGEFNKKVLIKKIKQKIKIKFASEILEVVFDKKIELFRALKKEEKPLTISSIMQEKDLITVINKKDQKKYESITKIFPNAKVILSDDLKFKDLKENSVLFLDASNSIVSQVYPHVESNTENSYMIVKPHIYNTSKKMMMLNIGLYKKSYFRLIKHYSKQQSVIFTKDGIIKKMHNSNNGIKAEFNSVPTVSKIEKEESLKDILSNINKEKIIYIGESHTNFSHHLNQLRVIKSLHESGKKVTIAMEMFQKPFQKDLDEYLAGSTTLNEFLKNSQYFKRWKFDYNLYKPIIDYAKKNNLPIVALNIDRSITQKVSKKGLFSLNQKQKELIPNIIDQSNLDYKKALENIFKQHGTPNDKSHKLNLNFFYQAQLIWDEIMAQNIDEYMQKNPNKTVVVIVGSGHLANHDGIPSRVYKRNALAYKVMLNDLNISKSNDIKIENRNTSKVQKQNKLGTYLKENQDMTVLKTVEGSYSQKIGIKKDDKILEINGKKIESIYDIKRVLYFIDDLKQVNIKVKRGNKILELKFN